MEDTLEGRPSQINKNKNLGRNISAKINGDELEPRFRRQIRNCFIEDIVEIRYNNINDSKDLELYLEHRREKIII